MTLTLIPPRNHSPYWSTLERETVLETGPNYIRTREMNRWHRPRCGTSTPSGGPSYTVWCGQVISRHREYVGVEEITDGLPLCGTCEGRAAGAGQISLDGLPLVFSPAPLRVPKACPGTRSYCYRPLDDRQRRGVCLVCGFEGKLTSYSTLSWDRPPSIQKHTPGSALIDPCPLHGWRCLRPAPGLDGVRCGAPKPRSEQESDDAR